MKRSVGEKVFTVFNTVFMIVMIIVTLYPFLYVVFASLSDSNLLMAHRGPLIAPLGFNLNSYKAVLTYKKIFTGYRNTLIIMGGGLSLSLILTFFGAYVLSEKSRMIARPMMIMIMITMFFSGGLIPFYYTIKNLGMYNTLWAVIIPGALNTFNMIILRTGFESVPISLKESAKLDGAGDFTILFRIVLPLSLPIIAVVMLYYAVGIWNSWFNAMIFLRDQKLYPLQLVMREILIGNETSALQNGASMDNQQAISETLKYAMIVVSTVPILVIYPFLQKYFVKGTMIGAVKE